MRSFGPLYNVPDRTDQQCQLQVVGSSHKIKKDPEAGKVQCVRSNVGNTQVANRLLVAPYAVQRWGLECHWELSQICDSERAFTIKGFFDRL